MKKDDWIKVLFPSIVAWILGRMSVMPTNDLLTYGVPIILLVVMVIGIKWYSEPDERMKHTEDLKKGIGRWKKGLPAISAHKLQVLGFGILTGYRDGISPFVAPFVQGTFKNNETRIGIENDYIFKDLLFHLEKQDPQIIMLWKEFKEKYMEQYKEGKELVSEMAKELTEQVERETGIGQLKITKYGIETKSISERFLNVIFNACIVYAEGEKEEFSKFYESFESRTGYRENSLEYSILDLDTGFITIEKGLLEEKEFKTKMDNVMRWMFEKAKIDYYPKGKKLVNLIEELNSLECRVEKHLDQQLLYHVFKGKCEYLN